jgi:hypothetical protein
LRPAHAYLVVANTRLCQKPSDGRSEFDSKISTNIIME